MTDENWTLVDRARGGDSEAFAELYRRHGRQAFNVALRMTGNDWDAADVTQDAFAKAFRALPSFDGRARFSTWLHRIVMNTAYDHLRRKRTSATEEEMLERARRSGMDDEETHTPYPGRSIAGSQGLDPAEDRISEPVREALLDLDEGFRSAVVLCDLLGYSYADTAEILEVREGTVKSRLYRARALLAESLRRRGYEPFDDSDDAGHGSSDGSSAGEAADESARSRGTPGTAQHENTSK